MQTEGKARKLAAQSSSDDAPNKKEARIEEVPLPEDEDGGGDDDMGGREEDQGNKDNKDKGDKLDKLENMMMKMMTMMTDMKGDMSKVTDEMASAMAIAKEAKIQYDNIVKSLKVVENEMVTLQETTITKDELPGLVRAIVTDTAGLDSRTPGTQGARGSGWHGSSG